MPISDPTTTPMSPAMNSHWLKPVPYFAHHLLERGATKYTVLVTLFRRANCIFASFRSRNGEALKVAETFQGGGHANAAGAILPKSVRTIEDGLDFLRLMLKPHPPEAHDGFNSLDGLLAGIDLEKKAD